MTAVQGSEGTHAYYEDRGWAEEDGQLVEAALFGTKEDGPLRRAGYLESCGRIRAALEQAGPPLNLLETGGGGQPELEILDLCDRYTGLDFSEQGLTLAAEVLAGHDLDVRLVHGDMCALPFDDGEFDAVYSAHALYHIADEPSQRRAFDEIIRVLRPGGVAVLVLVNPRPILFPGRAAKRIIADTPLLADVANRIRPTPPIPFKPLTMSTMRGLLEPHGRVDIVTAGIATVAFNQRVSEYTLVGKRLWQVFGALQTRAPRLSARLGNGIQITFVKDR